MNLFKKRKSKIPEICNVLTDFGVWGTRACVIGALIFAAITASASLTYDLHERKVRREKEKRFNQTIR